MEGGQESLSSKLEDFNCRYQFTESKAFTGNVKPTRDDKKKMMISKVKSESQIHSQDGVAAGRNERSFGLTDSGSTVALLGKARTRCWVAQNSRWKIQKISSTFRSKIESA